MRMGQYDALGRGDSGDKAIELGLSAFSGQARPSYLPTKTAIAQESVHHLRYQTGQVRRVCLSALDLH